MVQGTAREVLIAEDDADIRAALVLIFEREGAHVTAVADGSSALELASAQTDLVILDVMMPGIDGVEVTQRLRADERTHRAAIVVVSGRDDEDSAVRALEAGADDYVRKPFGGRELVARVASVMTRADRPREQPEPAKNDELRQRQVRALRTMLEHDGLLKVALQPIWDLNERRILGYEALARPTHRSGFAGPMDAFTVAAEEGLGDELTERSIRAALDRAGELEDGQLLFINANPSFLGRGLLDPERLRIAATAAGITTDRIVIEITEQIGADIGQVVLAADRLKEAGFKLALDDVGTGSAGLHLMRMLTLDFLKVDRSIVRSAHCNQASRSVLVAIVAYGSEAGAYVIAEGIEDAPMLTTLRSVTGEAKLPQTIGGGQGYLLGRPSERELEPAVDVPDCLAPAA